MGDIIGRRFAGLLFDMDGTLIDSVAVAERVWRRWAESRGIEPEALLATMPGVRTIETVARWAPDADAAAEADGIMREEMDDVAGVVAIDGAQAFLASIPEGRWAIVTSASRELAQRRMAVAGIPQPAVLVTADDVATGKPAPDCYLAAARKLGISARDALVFEDAPAGIAAGEAAGAEVLVISATHAAPLATTHPMRRDYRGLIARGDGEGVAILAA